MLLTHDQIAQFHREGYLLLHGFYPAELIDEVCQGIYQVIGKVMEKYSISDERSAFSVDSFDQAYNALITNDRQLGSEIYDAVKYIPAFWKLVSDSSHSALMKQLRPDALPAVASSGCGIRIDNPSEDRYRALWHQEYPAQLRSLDGLVFWSPLLPITTELGPVVICPGSHTEGALPVLRLSTASSGRTGAYGLKLLNEEALLQKYQKVSPLTNPGDLLLMDFLTLHASGFNRSLRSRWSMQFRYFNMAEATGIRHGWKGSYAEGVDFASIHPELIAES
jgi:ectoine hydroxylase-related dioxygenase (phytanoyl-CoA dioxygenase family)